MRTKELYEYAASKYSYDPETGEVRNIRTGYVMGSKQKGDYAILNVKTNRKRTSLEVHRFAWYCIHGMIPEGMQIDHINGDTRDNRIKNLRIVSPRENQRNRREHRRGKLCGCYFHKASGKWAAQLKYKGELHYIGLFPTEVEAHSAYLIAVERALQEGYVDKTGKREAAVQAQAHRDTPPTKPDHK